MSAITSGSQVSRNASFLTIAYSMQKILAFVYFTFIARLVTEDSVGKYVFAISLTTIFSILIDLGLTSVFIREVARKKEALTQYLNHILSLKIPLALIAYAGALIAVIALHKEPLVVTMVALAGAVMIFDSFSLTFWGVFRGYQQLQYESVAIVINQICIFAVGLGGLVLGYPLWVLVAGLLAGSLFSFVFSFVLLVRRHQYRFHFDFSRNILKPLLLMALPFALAGIFTRVYSYIDQILLSTLIGDTELGWYSVAYKITFALQFIPSAFAASLYPAMSNYYEHAREKLAGIFEKSMYFLMVLSIPISVGTVVIASDLITLVYTQRYAESIITLQILILAMPAIFLAFPVGAMLNSCHKQHLNTINLGITMIINIILNIILIPRFAHVGASIAAVVSLYYLFFANMYFVKTITAYNHVYLWKSFFQAVVAALCMGGVVYVADEYIGLIPAILSGVIVYPIALYFFGGLQKSDFDFIRTSIQRR